MSERRPNIGLLVANITDPYSRDVARGAMAAAKELNVDLVIFPGKYLGLEHKYEDLDTRYEYQYNVLFDYAAKAKLDYVIAAVGTIGFALSDEEKREFLSAFDGTPLLCLSSDLEGFDYMLYNNRTGVASAMDYLIKHGRKHIGIMAGNFNNEECIERFEEYRSGLERGGLEYDERFVTECDIGVEASPSARALLERCPEMDACFCVNDYVAEQFCEEAKKLGREIGSDIAVVGFDDIPLASSMRPPLASIKADASELGARAVLRAVNKLRGITDDCSVLPTRFIPRSSCYSGRFKDMTSHRLFAGDRDTIKVRIADFADEMSENASAAEELGSMLYGVFENVSSRFIGSTADEKSAAEAKAVLKELLNGKYSETIGPASLYAAVGSLLMHIIRHCDEQNLPLIEKLYAEIASEQNSLSADISAAEFAQRTHLDNIFIRDALMFTSSMQESYAYILRRLCNIGSDTSYIVVLEEPITHLPRTHLPDDLHYYLKSYAYGGEFYSVPQESQLVKLDELFKDDRLASDRRHTFIVADLYTASQQYGIAVLEPRTESFFDELELVTYQLSSAVRTLYIMRQQEELVSELHSKNSALETLSRIDDLTGVLNRRGFYTAAEELIREKGSSAEFIVCYADMDDLKSVNDIYGHAEGDFGIRLVAKCLDEMFGGKALIGRFGGDEFAAVVPAGEDVTIEEAQHRRAEFITAFNESRAKPYTFSLSAGTVQCVLKDSYDLYAAITKADGVLYEEKSRKHAGRNARGDN